MSIISYKNRVNRVKQPKQEEQHQTAWNRAEHTEKGTGYRNTLRLSVN